VAVVAAAATLLGLLAWQGRDEAGQAGPRQGRQGRDEAPVSLLSASAALRLQQRQKLGEEEKDWGARIQALTGKPHVGAARMQALSESTRGQNFAAMKAAGAAARLQTLTETTGSKAASTTLEWSERIDGVETKYRELVAGSKEETALQERKVQEIFGSEMKKLAAAGHIKDERLRRDEENAETTILAEKKEYEIRKQLEALQMHAKLKAQHLTNQLNAAHILALKYKQEVVADALPTGVHVNLPLGLAKEVGMVSASMRNSTALLGASFAKQLNKITGAAAADAVQATKAVVANAQKAKIEQQKQAAARAKATAEEARKEAARTEKIEEAEDRKEKREKEIVAALAAKERKEKRENERVAAKAAAEAAKQKLAAEQAATAKQHTAKLAVEKKKEEMKEEQRKLRCTHDNCPLDTMDAATVVNGDSIHKMEHLAQEGHGVAKSQALAMFERLTSQIQSDFSQVTGFAQHQEHVLDVKHITKDTASYLGQQVALSLVRDSAQDGTQTGESL